MQEKPCFMPTSYFGDELSVAWGLMGISLQWPQDGAGPQELGTDARAGD